VRSPILWIAALCLIGLVARTHAGTRTIEGRIVGVSDGDTITMLDAEHRQHKIRLDGIDAPESGQPFGRASKQHLADLLANREGVAECSKTDRYRREVCRVLVGGIDVGLEQIRAGLAWFFRRYARELSPDRRQQYADTEAQAQAGRRGLWADAAPVAPWDWRRPEQTRGMTRDPHHALEPKGQSLEP
jgi:endonuclease YncB( thermonuclease family)